MTDHGPLGGTPSSWSGQLQSSRAETDATHDSSRIAPSTHDDPTAVGRGQRFEAVTAPTAPCDSLDQTSAGPSLRRGPINLRWILAQTTDQTARHAGHLDLLRDAVTAS